MATQLSEPKSLAPMEISWEPLPDDFRLEEKPVENINHPLLAGVLREILEIAGYILPTMLIASNFGLYVTLNNQPIIKAPDWVFVNRVNEVLRERKSYTPNLEGDIPGVVMEFVSNSEGEEYSSKQTHPPGKWFFYEQIIKVPIYIIFYPDGGLLEFYKLENGHYQLKLPDENGRHWIDSMGLFLGTWQGTKESRTGYWLRWWDEAGNLLPWAVEKVEIERQRAEQERQQKERLIAYLQSQGIDPNNLPPMDSN